MTEILIILALLCAGTCVIELIPLLFVRNSGQWIKASLLCNVITNPIVNVLLALASLVVSDRAIYIAIMILLEVAVIAFEAFIFRQVTGESVQKCILISAMINLCSFAVGLFLSILLNPSSGGGAPSPLDDIEVYG